MEKNFWKERSDACGTYCDPDTEEGASKTRQSELDQTDINKIVARFERSGLPLPTGESRFLDLSEVPDFREAMDHINRARDYFMSLPAKSRAVFENDPAVFLDKVNDPSQLALLVEAGVIPKNEVKVLETPAQVELKARAGRKAAAKESREIAAELDQEIPAKK